MTGAEWSIEVTGRGGKVVVGVGPDGGTIGVAGVGVRVGLEAGTNVGCMGAGGGPGAEDAG